MFGGKKSKEAQEKIQELEVVQSRYMKLEEDVKSIKNASDEIFANLDSQDIQLDQGLNHVLDMVKEEKEKTESIADKINNLAVTFEDVSSKNEQIKSRLEESDEAFSEGKKAVEILAETVELCSKASEHAKDKQEKEAEALKQPLEKLDEMSEAAKGMTTIALNAAIEAGRLGTVGLDFLQAAENVRKLSEEYTRMIEGLKGEMQEIQEQLACGEYLVELSDLLQKTKEAADTMKVFDVEKKVIEGDLTDQVLIRQETIKEIQDILAKKDDSYQAILEQMEYIAQNHSDGKAAKGNLEEKLELFYGKAL